MGIPDPWVSIILVFAAFRIWRLLAKDDVLSRPRRWVVKLPRDWEEGSPIPDEYRLELAKFISCDSCFGFWITLVLWLVWQVTPFWTTCFSMPLAMSAGVIVVRSRLAPDE